MAPTGEQLDNWLRDHLPYELSMLRYTLREMHSAQTQGDYNAYYESFAIHSRVLFDFITGREPKNVRAVCFVPDYDCPKRKRDQVQSFMNKINPAVAHAGPTRPSDLGDKVQRADCVRVGFWIEEMMRPFVSGLSPKDREKWNAEMARDDLAITVSTFQESRDQPLVARMPTGFTGSKGFSGRTEAE